MADVRIGSGPFFERGIESIVGTPTAQLLPTPGSLSPSELVLPAALVELLSADNLESLLNFWVRPALVDRDMLTPQRFRVVMEAALAFFTSLARDVRARNPRAGTLLDGAATVLSEELELRDLLQMYRHALLQA